MCGLQWFSVERRVIDHKFPPRRDPMGSLSRSGATEEFPLLVFLLDADMGSGKRGASVGIITSEVPIDRHGYVYLRSW
jgi:hypothetical protein